MTQKFGSLISMIAAGTRNRKIPSTAKSTRLNLSTRGSTKPSTKVNFQVNQTSLAPVIAAYMMISEGLTRDSVTCRRKRHVLSSMIVLFTFLLCIQHCTYRPTCNRTCTFFLDLWLSCLTSNDLLQLSVDLFPPCQVFSKHS